MPEKGSCYKEAQNTGCFWRKAARKNDRRRIQFFDSEIFRIPAEVKTLDMAMHVVSEVKIKESKIKEPWKG